MPTGKGAVHPTVGGGYDPMSSSPACGLMQVIGQPFNFNPTADTLHVSLHTATPYDPTSSPSHITWTTGQTTVEHVSWSALASPARTAISSVTSSPPDLVVPGESVVDRIDRLLAEEDRDSRAEPGRDTGDSAEYHRGPRRPAGGWECQVCYRETRWPYEPARSVPAAVTDDETLCVAHGGPQPESVMAAAVRLRDLRDRVATTDELRAAQQQVMAELNQRIAAQIEAVCAEFNATGVLDADTFRRAAGG